MIQNWISFYSILVSVFVTVSGKCYFPGELQGVWATQAAPDIPNVPIGYSMVTITANEISSWGQCYSKINNNIILGHRGPEPSVPCFRCFGLVVASYNIAALISSNLGMCFSSVEDALRSCPKTERGSNHIVLYKIRSSWGDTSLKESQCLLNGNYFFTFEKGQNKYRGSRGMSCEQPTSEMSNCPFGFSLSLQYRDCTFEEPRAANWYCLGSWKGLDGQTYTAVLDTYSKEGDGKPKYKCGIYREDKKTKRVYLAFSRDSTCTNDLVSAEEGHERYVLHRAPTSPLPNSVVEKICRFPRNLRGEWGNMEILKNSISYYDDQSFSTLNMQCSRAFINADKYLVYTRTECGKWFYTCVLLKKRSENVIEIMFGKKKSDNLFVELCEDQQFGNSTHWVTLARSIIKYPTSCPIVGSYKGELPDSPGYCAQLSSDCKRTNMMYYAVDECNNPMALFEQRQLDEKTRSRSRNSDNQGFRNPVPQPINDNTIRRPSLVEIRTPEEIQIGAINLLTSNTRSGLKDPGYDASSIRGASLIVNKRKRSARSFDSYFKRNPRTTTISFIWGNNQPVSTTTTRRPFYQQEPKRKIFFDTSNGGFNKETIPDNIHNSRISNTNQFNQNPSNRFDSRLSDGQTRTWGHHTSFLGHGHRGNNNQNTFFRDRNSNRHNDRGFDTPSQQRNQGQEYPRSIWSDKIVGTDERKHHNNQERFNERPQSFSNRGISILQDRGQTFRGPNPEIIQEAPRRNPISISNPELTRREPVSVSNHELPRIHDSIPIHKIPGRIPESILSQESPRRVHASVTNQELPRRGQTSVTNQELPRREPVSINNKDTFLGRNSFKPQDFSPGQSVSNGNSNSMISSTLREIDHRPESDNTKSHNEIKHKHNKFEIKATKEEREYQCIGSWEEDGRIFTLTKRTDIQTYECFTGIKGRKGVVYMKETGPWCSRKTDPNDKGMKTILKEECVEESSRSKIDRKSSVNEPWREFRRVPSSGPPRVRTTVRTWQPITGRPKSNASKSSSQQAIYILIGLYMYYILCIDM